MQRYRVALAVTPAEIAEARHIRARVYREEEGLWAADDGSLASAREEGPPDPCDTAAETALLVAYAGAEAVGTIRVSTLAPPSASRGPGKDRGTSAGTAKAPLGTANLPAGTAAGLVDAGGVGGAHGGNAPSACRSASMG